MTMEDKWLDDIRSKMAGFEEVPPDGLWDGINAALDRRQSVLTARSRRIVWWRLAGAAAALLAALPMGIEQWRQPQRPVVTAVQRPVESQPPAGGGTLLAAGPVASGRPSEPVTETGPDAGHPQDEAGRMPDAPEEGAAIVSQGSSPADSVGRRIRREQRVEPVRNDILLADGGPRRRSHGRLAVGVFAANVPGGAVADYGGGRASLMNTVLASEKLVPLVYGSRVTATVRSVSEQTPPKASMKHKQPVRFGVSVGYALNDRVELESGLSYTYLSSSLYSSDEDYSFRVRQSLHYVGIPLGVNVSLWKNRRWDVYLSAGGMAEKCVDGELEMDYRQPGQEGSSVHEPIKEKPWQWSVNGAAGVQVNLSTWAGLYVEPGVSYYFDNGSTVSNIYKEKPLNFNLELGLRFSFGRSEKSR